MQYRRDYTKGARYFFTLVTFLRNPLFDQPEKVSRSVGWKYSRIHRYIRHKIISPD